MNNAPKLPKHRRLILAAGIPRSGSTWLFNAIRFILAKSGRSVEGAWVDDLETLTLPECEDLVVKLHMPDDALAQLSRITFTSHRDLRDMAASAQDMRWIATEEELLSVVCQWRWQHDYWSARSVYDVPYQEMINAPGPVALRIAQLLEVTLVVPDIDEVVAQLSRLAADVARITDHHDRTTLMHPGHRVDGRPGSWKERLPAEISDKIVSAHRDWFVRLGYITEA